MDIKLGHSLDVEFIGRQHRIRRANDENRQGDQQVVGKASAEDIRKIVVGLFEHDRRNGNLGDFGSGVKPLCTGPDIAIQLTLIYGGHRSKKGPNRELISGKADESPCAMERATKKNYFITYGG